MLSPKQLKLLETLAAAGGRRPLLRFGQFVDESSFRAGLGEPALAADDDLEQALKDFVGLGRK